MGRRVRWYVETLHCMLERPAKVTSVNFENNMRLTPKQIGWPKTLSKMVCLNKPESLTSQVKLLLVSVSHPLPESREGIFIIHL